MRKPDINSGWCDRLRTLYEKKGYKVDERGELLRAVKDMYKCGALIYTGNEDMNKVYQNSRRIAYNHITQDRTPDMDWVRTYQIFFSCSYDYLFGLIDRPTHELKTVGDITGLSDDACDTLIQLNRVWRAHKESRIRVDGEVYQPLDPQLKYSDIVSALLEHPEFERMIEDLRIAIEMYAVVKYEDLDSYDYGGGERVLGQHLMLVAKEFLDIAENAVRYVYSQKMLRDVMQGFPAYWESIQKTAMHFRTMDIQ